MDLERVWLQKMAAKCWLADVLKEDINLPLAVKTRSISILFFLEHLRQVASDVASLPFFLE